MNDPKTALTRWHIRSTAQQEALAEEIVRRAFERRYPWMSLGAQEREALRGHAPPSLVRDVMSRARKALTALEREKSHRPRAGRWLSMSEAAAAMNVSLSWIKESLRTGVGRRRLGYPWYDGRRWHIPAAACDPRSRATFLSHLPDGEPPENTALLE